MATTDAKPGFRLPWSPDRGNATNADSASTTDPEIEMPTMIEAAPVVTDDLPIVAPEPEQEPARPASIAAPEPARKPNKFMADLTRAMGVAAESARAETLARFGADARAHIESIQASTQTVATELRKSADDDVAAIRERSKAEIARIREQTDERVTDRKSTLEREIDAHAGTIAARVERVQARVDAFEAVMTSFFERLLRETDPTRFASMAEGLPEPPHFDVDESIDHVGSIEAPPEHPVEPAVVAASVPQADPTVDLISIGNEAPSAATATSDPLANALGLTPDFAAAAEAEAEAFNVDDPSTESDIPLIAEHALAARLAALVPDAQNATDTASTKLIVAGLISVASIAGFKRILSRVPGVQSVGVSSGPDGEFVFAVTHDATVSMHDVVPTLPGYAARVTAQADGELTVSASDPETES